MCYYLYYISKKNRLIHCNAYGTYTIADIKRLVLLMVRDRDYRSSYNIIVDTREVVFTPVLSEILDFSGFITGIKEHFKGKIALIVKSRTLYNLFKIGSHHTKNSGIMVDIFLDIMSAEVWLSERRRRKRPDITVS